MVVELLSRWIWSISEGGVAFVAAMVTVGLSVVGLAQLARWIMRDE